MRNVANVDGCESFFRRGHAGRRRKANVAGYENGLLGDPGLLYQLISIIGIGCRVVESFVLRWDLGERQDEVLRRGILRTHHHLRSAD
jgi:hypothetical protein